MATEEAKKLVEDMYPFPKQVEEAWDIAQKHLYTAYYQGVYDEFTNPSEHLDPPDHNTVD